MTPEVGTELVNPKAGTRTVFTATAESTGGEYVEIEATYRRMVGLVCTPLSLGSTSTRSTTPAGPRSA